MKIHARIICTIAILSTIVFLPSCVSNKKITIFSQLESDSSSVIHKSKSDNTIKTGDILQISVFTLDEETKRLLNNVTSTTSAASGTSSGPGYLVDDSGSIKLPLLGEISCNGLVKEQLEEKIKTALVVNKIAIDPIVTVRITNFKITILGEVNKPGVINVSNEKINIVEAIGLAGDLTIYANRENLLLIREVNGKRIYKRFSLNDPNIFNKDYFDLQNQDVLYIEPGKAKAATLDRSTQFISIGLSVITLIILVYSQVLAN